MVLRRLADTAPRGTKLTSLTSTPELARHIGKACKALRLSSFGAHAPRAGWATAERLRGRLFTEIQEDGRWESAASCRRYLDALDALQVLKMAANLQKVDLSLDVNNDGKITIDDARIILNMARPS